MEANGESFERASFLAENEAFRKFHVYISLLLFVILGCYKRRLHLTWFPLAGVRMEGYINAGVYIRSVYMRICMNLEFCIRDINTANVRIF